MARRTPLAKARATGRLAVNPGRFRDRADPKVKPLGNASPHLNELERKAWRAFRKEIPWLAESDRCAVEIACRLRANMWTGKAKVSSFSQLRMLLASFGARPSDRSRISAPDDAEDDPAEGFFH